ncbi:MAG TPA: ABC transporter permease [Candidatus Bathyarchaeia archaeon]|nr:ABC transporter permease [Candidatus Bathyarchaeia archaeon]
MLVRALIESMFKAFYIAKKDARVYFFKWPNITFGLFLPAIIYLAFSVGRPTEISSTMPGLVAMASLFGAGAIQSVALPLERAKGTFDRLLTAPVSLTTIIVGKVLGGFFFGMVLSMAYSLIVIPLSGATVSNPFLFAFGIILSSFVFSALGVCISAPFRDIPEAMPPATLLRVSMVFLSGVLIPVATMPNFLQIIAYLLPLTYAVDMLQQAMTGQIAAQLFLVDTSALVVFSFFFFVVAVWILKRTLH